MKFNLYEPNQLVCYMGNLHRVIWAVRDKVNLQLIGTYGPGMTQIGATINSLAYNQRIVPITHWSLYRA